MIYNKPVQVEDDVFITVYDVKYKPNEQNPKCVVLDCEVHIPDHDIKRMGEYLVYYPAMNTFSILFGNRHIIINKLMEE